MRRFATLAAALALFFVVPAAAEARVIAKIDLSSQTMSVYVNGSLRHSWAISAARRGYRTPTGNYSPKWLARMHYSSRYNNSPMPHSIFFYRGYAIHGTNHISRLGRPASHGCVRLHPRNARTLFSLVRAHGKRNTRIVIRR